MDDAKIYVCYEEQEANGDDGETVRAAFFIFGLIAGFCIGWAWGMS